MFMFCLRNIFIMHQHFAELPLYLREKGLTLYLSLRLKPRRLGPSRQGVFQRFRARNFRTKQVAKGKISPLRRFSIPFRECLGSYWVPEHPRPIKTNRVRIQNPDPTITNGLRNKSKGEVDPVSSRTPKVDLKRKTLGPRYSHSSPLLDEGFPPTSLVNKRIPKANITADERSGPKSAFKRFHYLRFLSVLSLFFCLFVFFNFF